MNRLEVLCTTMHQNDFSKYQEMNIQSDVVFANQSDRFSFEEIKINNNNVKMITMSQRGVGKNRNTALLYAKGDICIFADDDVVYENGYVEMIMKAFNHVPDADVLIFNLTTNSERKQKLNNSIKRCRVWSVLSYGTCRIAFKLDKIKRANIWFTQLFGGGSQYPSGEDSMWLIEALNKGLRIYTYPQVIGEVKQETSSWFKGYEREFYFGKGAWIQAALPKFKYLMFIYYLIRLKSLTKLTRKEVLKMLKTGAKAYQNGQTYADIQD